MTTMNLLKKFILEAIGSNNMRGARTAEIPHNGSTIARTTTHQNSNIIDDEENEEQLEKQDNVEHPKAAVVLIMSDDGKILCVSRKDDPTQLGLPGGKVDPGEEPREAAIRELKEETGLDAIDMREVFCEVDESDYEVHAFVCEADGEINTDESGVIRWVTPNVLLDPDQCPWTVYMEGLFKKIGLR